ncbi:MAG: hypothetical protein U9Q95_01865, partial [Candidatus Eisenbacteria bacterium]|nr:hypothetical protein [Candidatus Eisenbacteria bacterium]
YSCKESGSAFEYPLLRSVLEDPGEETVVGELAAQFVDVVWTVLCGDLQSGLDRTVESTG